MSKRVVGDSVVLLPISLCSLFESPLTTKQIEDIGVDTYVKCNVPLATYLTICSFVKRKSYSQELTIRYSDRVLRFFASGVIYFYIYRK